MAKKKKQEPSLKLLPKLEREVNAFLIGLPGKEKLEMAFLKGFKQGSKIKRLPKESSDIR